MVDVRKEFVVCFLNRADVVLDRGAVSDSLRDALRRGEGGGFEDFWRAFRGIDNCMRNSVENTFFAHVWEIQ